MVHVDGVEHPLLRGMHPGRQGPDEEGLRLGDHERLDHRAPGRARPLLGPRSSQSGRFDHEGHGGELS